MLRCGLSDDFVKRGFENLDGVRKRLARTKVTFGIECLHAADDDVSDGGDIQIARTYILTLIPRTPCLNMTCLTA